MEVNIYCDESCHLKHSNRYMVLGGVSCPKDHCKEVFSKIRSLKLKYGLKAGFEVKWTKVSGSEKFLPFYKELLGLFFSDQYLGFRAIIIDKQGLDHEKFNQSHDTWYYKMYFRLISNILHAGSEYSIYLDIKDTRSTKKTQELKEILCNNVDYSYREDIIQQIQLVRSNEVALVQITDLIIGLLQYKYNSSNTTGAKAALLKFFEKEYQIDITKNTLPTEQKFNLFHWTCR